MFVSYFFYCFIIFLVSEVVDALAGGALQVPASSCRGAQLEYFGMQFDALLFSSFSSEPSPSLALSV